MLATNLFSKPPLFWNVNPVLPDLQSFQKQVEILIFISVNQFEALKTPNRPNKHVSGPQLVPWAPRYRCDSIVMIMVPFSKNLVRCPLSFALSLSV